MNIRVGIIRSGVKSGTVKIKVRMVADLRRGLIARPKWVRGIYVYMPGVQHHSIGKQMVAFYRFSRIEGISQRRGLSCYGVLL